MDRVRRSLLHACLALLPILGVAWILSIPNYFGLALVSQQVVAVVLGCATAAALLNYPYFRRAVALDVVLALAAIAAWSWMAVNFELWIVSMADRTPDMWGPGIVAIALALEGLRKAAGRVIAGLVWLLIAYAYFGNLLPGTLEAEVFPPTKTILYLYADNNGVPGIVLRVVTELVLAFIVFGKLLQISGATAFFNDLAMSWMGHRRGGPAKVAVVASSAFGTISGSTVGNIMSTGIVTIPMMKKSGFRPRHAGAIEAVASNGGQIAPPVMGATAFIIAEFLEVPYEDVVAAALVPAILYFVVLFLQVDGLAVRYGIRGAPREALPKVLATLAGGWVFAIPLAILIYFLFGLGYNPGLSALYAAAAVLLLLLLKRALQRQTVTAAEIRELFVGGGLNLMPLLLIAGGAGIIIGVMNSTGLAFQLSLILTAIGQSSGLLTMLLLTAVICIVLGMGMPTAAVYIVLVSVIAPALIEMGLTPMAAHLFLFYFGLLSMLTPPVAVASMVAAEIAGSDMWRTGFSGVQLAVAAYLLPFLWAFNPAILLDGGWLAIGYALATCLAAGYILGRMAVVAGRGIAGRLHAGLLFALALASGSATVWTGPDSALSLAPAGAAVALTLLLDARSPALRAGPSNDRTA